MPPLKHSRPNTAFSAASLLVLSGLLLGCTPDSGTVEITLHNAETAAPVAGGLLCIEVGGAYQPTPDPAKGNPSWQYAALTDDSGYTELILPTGKYGFHSFAEGYLYGTKVDEVDSEVFALTIQTSPLSPEDEVPSVTDFTLDPATVAPGGTVEVSVNAVSAAPNKPLSEEILVIIPSMQMCAAMDPPSAGTPGVSYPDGIYSKTLTAPTEPGTYDVWISVTSEHCVTAPPISLQLTVQ